MAESEKHPSKAKKSKEPAIEDKPFAKFIQEHYLPTLKDSLTDQGLGDVELDFKQQPFLGGNETCWQVLGSWQQGRRRFMVGFPEENIKGTKIFSLATDGASPSILEPFMIDERKVTLDLLVLYTLQRLNGQKWLTRN